MDRRPSFSAARRDFALTVVYILLGTFFEEMSSILITLPLVLPIIVNLGYDPLWWGLSA